MMGISAVGRISESLGRRFTAKVCRRLLNSSSGTIINSPSDEKGDDDHVSPWLMRRPQKLNGKRLYSFYSVEEKKKRVFEEIGAELKSNSTKIVGSSHGWLASFDQSNDALFLTDPVRRRQIKLPPLATLPDSDGWVSRIIISDDSADECRALMSYGPHQTLAFCVPGRSHSWFPIDDEVEYLGRKYENFVYSKRRKSFFCIKRVLYSQLNHTTEVLESWDVSDPRSPSLSWSLGPMHEPLHFDCIYYSWPGASTEMSDFKARKCLHLKYLVMDEASDRLFVVVRHVIPRLSPDGDIRPTLIFGAYRGFDCAYPYKTFDFDVFEIDMEREAVSHVDAASLGGLALFVGINHSFVVRPSPGTSRLKPNSIYFTELTEHVSWYYSGHDNGVFDYQTRTFSNLPHSKDFHSIKPRKRSIQEILSTPLPLWYTPNQSNVAGDD